MALPSEKKKNYDTCKIMYELPKTCENKDDCQTASFFEKHKVHLIVGTVALVVFFMFIPFGKTTWRKITSYFAPKKLSYPSGRLRPSSVLQRSADDMRRYMRAQRALA